MANKRIDLRTYGRLACEDVEGETTVTSSCGDDEEDEEQRSGWSFLPTDMLRLILLRLFTGDRLAFGAVCRSWSLKFIGPTLTNLPPKDWPFFSSPSLMLPRINNSACKLFHSVYNEFYYLNMPELVDAEIHFSKYGWLLMSGDNQQKLFFFNPFTRAKMELPPVDPKFYILAMRLFSPPTAAEWSVVGIFDNRLKYSEIDSIENTGSYKLQIGVLSSESNRWTYYNFRDRRDFQASNGTLVLHRGYYCSLDVKGRLTMIDPRDMRWWVAPLKLNGSFRKVMLQNFLVEVDETLLAVFVTGDGRKVSVYGLRNCGGSKWERITDLGDNMLYVSRTTSFCEVAVNKSMANKIFFPKFYGDSGVFYSLATKSYHSYDGKFCSKHSYGLKDIDSGIWIQPNP